MEGHELASEAAQGPAGAGGGSIEAAGPGHGRPSHQLGQLPSDATPQAAAVSCNRVSPFAASSSVDCKEHALQPEAEHGRQAVQVPPADGPLANLDQVIGRISNGSIREAGDYLFMRDHCFGPLPTTEGAVCAKIKSVAQVFRSNIESRAQEGDAIAQKLLALEMIREVEAARNTALAQAAEAGPAAGDRHLAESFSAHPDWAKALEYLRTAAVRDREAQALLQVYSARP